MGNERPSLGFEYEIAIALVDLTKDHTFAESPYPSIVGDFEVITCTKDCSILPPVKTLKFLACGYNPAAHVIPAPTIPGRFSFTGLDRAQTNTALGYHGEPCVIRVVTKLDEETVRTQYLSYIIPAITIKAPDGDEPGTVSGEGMFTLFYPET